MKEQELIENGLELCSDLIQNQRDAELITQVLQRLYEHGAVTSNQEKVHKFMTIGGQIPELTTTSDQMENTKDILLRFSLVFEELLEYAECFPRHKLDIIALATKMISDFTAKRIDAKAFDQVKLLDAITDLEYVVLGMYSAFKFEDIASNAFDEVHRSNMTKFLVKPDLETLKHNQPENTKSYPVNYENVLYIVYRDIDTGKIMKPLSYSPANLESLI